VVVAQRDRDRLQICLEIRRIAILAVAQQVQHGVLLALGPLALARDKGARIINCSFVAPASAISSSLSNAFWSVRNAGIIVVAAAGNFGSSGGGGGVNIDLDPQFPASFPMDNIVVVTGTTRRDEFSGYNFGTNTVHLGAPGTEIYSTYFGFDSNYGTLSGTSMAAPCVSGALALMRARFPGLNYRQLISRLLQTVEPLPSLAGRCSTGGRLNLARALGMGSFTWQFAGFDWVPTNGMTPLVLSADGVSLAQALPFGFSYFGETQNQVYVGANGLLGFTNVALGISANSDLPSAALPNAVLCPLWDDLNPELGGSIWFGQLGAAPNRRVIITWADVPHAITATSTTPTLNGGEAGKLATSTPVRTGASTEGCQPMSSQTMKAAVVPKLKR